MNIQEATQKAMKKNKVIYRESENRERTTLTAIKPTNSYEGCLLMSIKGTKLIMAGRKWNPKANDLIANDWTLLN